MHLGYIWFTVAVLVIIGGIFGGGSFTIVMVPVGVIAVILPLAAHAIGLKRMWGTDSDDPAVIRQKMAREKQASDQGPQTPDEFVDSRRQDQ